MAVTVESPKEDLALVFGTTGWQYVMKPSIEHRIRHLTEMLVAGERLEMEKVRELQAQIKLLRQMLAHKYEWWLFGVGDQGRDG